MPRYSEPASLDPAVDVPDDERILTELFEVAADADGKPYPLAQLVGDRVYTPVPGQRHDGREVDYDRDQPAIVFRVESGVPSREGLVRSFDLIVFCLGGAEPQRSEKNRARAKHIYRALVARLSLVKHEAVTSGVVLSMKETASGTPEVNPDNGDAWSYRSRWSVQLRAKGD